MSKHLLASLIPEISVAIFVLLYQMRAVFKGAMSRVYYVSIILLAAIFITMIREQVEYSSNFWIVNQFTNFAKLALLILCCLVTSLFVRLPKGFAYRGKSEYVSLAFLSLVGMMSMISAANFVVLYLAIELQAIPLYIMAAFDRDNAKSSESGMKYFILSALSSSVMLFGISFIYGIAGSLDFAVIQAIDNSIMAIGFALFIIGLLFKLSAAPFHFWTPDVYEGAPITSVAFFTSLPKITSIIILAKMLFILFPVMGSKFEMVFILVAGLSMLIGSFVGVVQTSLKRLLAYSTIANIGYVLALFAAGTVTIIPAAFFYILIYSFSSILLIGLLINLLGARVENLHLSQLSEIDIDRGGKIAVALLLLSLAGIPPLPGFFAKFYLIQNLVGLSYIKMAIIVVVTSVVSAFYYLRIVQKLYFTPQPENKTVTLNQEGKRLVFLSLAFILLFSLFAGFLIDMIMHITLL